MSEGRLTRDDLNPNVLESLRGPQGQQGPPGEPGPAGSDANVTSANITSALGYTPADNIGLTNLQQQVTVQLDEIVNSHKKPKVSFVWTDDDCTKRAYNWLVPLAESYGFKVTLAHAVDLVDNTYMTRAEILDAQSRGHEIVGHTKTHRPLAELTEAELEVELGGSKSTMQSFGVNPRHIIYPFGSYDKRVVEIARKYYESGYYSANPQIETYDNSSPISHFAFDRISIGAFGTRDWASIKKAIDTAIAQKTMCVITSHVDPNTAEDDAICIQTIEYIQSLGYNFETLSTAFDYHKNHFDIGDFDTVSKRSKYALAYDGSKLLANGSDVLNNHYAYAYSYGLVVPNADNIPLVLSDISNYNGNDFSLSGGKLQVKHRGRYKVGINAIWGSNPNGFRQIQIANFPANPSENKMALEGHTTNFNMSDELWLEPNSTVNVNLYQNSGNDLSINEISVSIRRLGNI